MAKIWDLHRKQIGEDLAGTNLTWNSGTDQLDASGGSGAPTDAQYLVLSLNGTLTTERVFVDGDGLTGTDSGANGNYTLDLNTPGTLSVSSSNSASGSHTHAITSSSNPGTAAALLATDAIGHLILDYLQMYSSTTPQFSITYNGGTDPDVHFTTDINGNLTIDPDGSIMTLQCDDVRIEEYIKHDGNTSTSIRFLTNNVELRAGGLLSLELDTTGILVDQYISHIGDIDTKLNFEADKLSVDVGGLTSAEIWETGGNKYVRLQDQALIGLNAAINNNMSDGISIDQGTADDELFALSSTTDVAHGMTTITNTEEFGFIKKVSALEGGVEFNGLTEGDEAFDIIGHVTTNQTSPLTTSVAAVNVIAKKKSGTTSGANDASALLFGVLDNTTAAFFVDTEGDLHVNGSTSLTAFDNEDDLSLIRAFERETSNPATLIDYEFDKFLNYRREDLEKFKLAKWSEHGLMWNVTKMVKAHNGAFGQVQDRLLNIERALGIDSETRRISDGTNSALNS